MARPSSSPRRSRTPKTGLSPEPWLTRLRVNSDVRRDMVRRIRRSIRAGHYENELKLQIALERLLRDA